MYMFNKVSTTETHARTLTKLAIYRVMSMLATMIFTLILGGSLSQAVAMTVTVFLVGSTHYYLYDRLWMYIPWQRSIDGNDSKKRSIVKTVTYRLTALLVVMLMAKLIFADTVIAFFVAVFKFVFNAILYFTIERIFNNISWGKISS